MLFPNLTLFWKKLKLISKLKLGEDQRHGLLCLISTLKISPENPQISNQNSETRVESRSRACSDTGRLLSAPVLTFYARHAPPIICSTYHSVVCIVCIVCIAYCTCSQILDMPILSAQHSRLQYAYCRFCIALHTVLKYLTYQYEYSTNQTVNVLKQLTHKIANPTYISDSMFISIIHLICRQLPISITPHATTYISVVLYSEVHLHQWVVHVAFIMSAAICYLCYIKQCLGRGGSVGGPSFVPLIYTHQGGGRGRWLPRGTRL